MTSNDGLNRRGKPINDDLHYSAEGYVTFGKRLAEAAIAKIGQYSDDTVTVIPGDTDEGR